MNNYLKRTYPLKAIRRRGDIKVLATVDLEPGQLFVPFFVSKNASIVVEDNAFKYNLDKTIAVDLEWEEREPTEDEKDVGLQETPFHAVTLLVKQETRLPNEIGWEAKDWNGDEELHPFWLIKRQDGGSGCNCKLFTEMVSVTSTLEFGDLKKRGFCMDLTAGGHCFHVWFPFIVNEDSIKKGDEIVLSRRKTEKPGDGKDHENAKVPTTVFDDLRCRERKRQRT